MKLWRRPFSSFLFVVTVLAGCAKGPAYYEQYQLKQLTVVLLDQQSLRERYESLYGKPALMLEADGQGETVKTVKGFFDYRTNTIYCSKMDFTVCGHELHHAMIGRFHSE